MHPRAVIACLSIALLGMASAEPLRVCLADSALRERASLAGRTDQVLARMRSHNPYFRMPPIGVRVADTQSVAALERCIGNDLRPPQETKT